MSDYPGIKRACFEIAIDNGGINRFRSEKKQSIEFEKWIAKQPAEMLPAIDVWLSAKSDEEIFIICCGGEGEPEQEALMADAPPFTNDLLNSYFEEVC